MPPKSPFDDLAALADDPEAVRLLAGIFESLRNMASMGGARSVAEALAASVTITGDDRMRAQYDALRREMLRYLETLDSGEIEGSARATITPSPEIPSEDVNRIASSLLSAAGRGRSPSRS